MALPSSSPKGQESYPLFPLKYTLSQFLYQMGTLFNYWGFFAMIIIGTAKMSAKEVCCILSFSAKLRQEGSKIENMGGKTS